MTGRGRSGYDQASRKDVGAFSAGIMATEAPLQDDGHGLAPAVRGWFVVNLAEARARGSEKVGTWTDLEPPEGFEDFGI